LDVRTARYVALSYSWGTKADAATQLKTESSTLSKHMQCIPIESMTQVMRDAVTVCRLLSIQYLWIDALCIIQDATGPNGFHNSDWERESEQMGLVFQNAYLTLCAASSSSCHESFLSRKADRLDLTYQSDLRPAISGTYSMIRVSSDVRVMPPEDFTTPPSLEYSHWWTRGWVFQEREMSSRLLIFGDIMMHLVCPYCQRSEIGIQTRPSGSANLPYLYSGVINRLEGDTTVSPEVFYLLYRGLAKRYSALSLTYDSDRLPAISGFAKRIGELSNDRYLAGLWQNSLHLDLLWTRLWKQPFGGALIPAEHLSLRDPMDTASRTAPSWSWACDVGEYWPGLVFCYFLEHDHDVRPEYRAIDGWTRTAGSNPYGKVVAGAIIVTSRAIYVSWDDEYRLTAKFGGFRLWNESTSSYLAHCHLDWTSDVVEDNGTRPINSPGMVFVLLTSSCSDSGTDLPERVEQSGSTSAGDDVQNGCQSCGEPGGKRNAWGLLLHPSISSPGKFVRIGVFTSRVKTGGGTEIFGNSVEETFEII